MHRILFFLSFALYLTSCGVNTLNNHNTQDVYSGTDTIEVNANNAVFDVSRKFSLQLDTVLNDSRCPKGVQCVWEGNAEVQLKIIMSSDGKTHYTKLNTNSKFSQDTTINNYRFKLLELNPYPENDKTFPHYNYRATVVVENNRNLF